MNAQLTAASIIRKAAQDSPDRTLAAGATPFMRAARSGDVEVMKLLLGHGADPKLANKDGVTALSVAAGIGYTDSNRGTEPQVLEAVILCFSLGLDVNAATDKGETAMHGAARREYDHRVSGRQRRERQCREQAGAYASRSRDGQGRRR